MSEKVYCKDCRHDWMMCCENPKGKHKVDTPHHIEIHGVAEVMQNKNNDCPWFERREPYKPTGFEKLLYWIRNWLSCGRWA